MNLKRDEGETADTFKLNLYTHLFSNNNFSALTGAIEINLTVFCYNIQISGAHLMYLHSITGPVRLHYMIFQHKISISALMSPSFCN